MKQLLITGFDPFGGETVNPSWEAVSRLPEVIGDFQLTAVRIPTVFRIAAETGRLNIADFPLLMHVDEIITGKKPVNIPWEDFTFRA